MPMVQNDKGEILTVGPNGPLATDVAGQVAPWLIAAPLMPCVAAND